MKPDIKASSGKRRWRIAGLLAVGVLVSYIDRVNLSVAHDALTAEFALSKAQFGFLLSAYNLTYCVCQLPVGVILDRFGVRRVGGIATFLWSLASFAAAIAHSLSQFWAARFLLGIGEAPLFPANAKAIGHWFPRSERDLATAIFDSAAKFASGIGVPLVGTVLLVLGWRVSFAMTGVFSLLYFFVFTKIYREPEEDAKLSAEELQHIRADHFNEKLPSHSETSKASLRELMTEPKVIGLALGVLAYNYTFYMLLTWLPSYLSLSLHTNLQKSFLYTAVPWLFATVTDLFVGGWAVDRLIKRGWNPGRLRMWVLAGGMFFGLGILFAAPAKTPATALFWITVSLCGLAAHSPIVWATPSLIAPRENVATVGGIVNFTGQIAAICAPIVTGYLSFANAFIVAGALLLGGIASYLLLLRRIEPFTVKRIA